MHQALQETEIVALEHAVELNALLVSVLLKVLLNGHVAAAYCHHNFVVRHLLHLLDFSAQQILVLVDLDDWYEGGEDRD